MVKIMEETKLHRSMSANSDVFTCSVDSGDSCLEQPMLDVSQPVLAWDWDDTLLCTSHLARCGVAITAESSEISETLRMELVDLARTVEQTLDLALSLGRVVIVTNAESGWVELTSLKFMPSIFEKYIRSYRIPIVSARSSFETPKCRCPVEWKRLAFEHLISSSFLGEVHLVSFGDSNHERQALKNTADKFSSLGNRLKSLKLIERPDVAALMKQHVLIRQCLLQLVEHPGSLDLCIQPTAVHSHHCHAA